MDRSNTIRSDESYAQTIRRRCATRASKLPVKSYATLNARSQEALIPYVDKYTYVPAYFSLFLRRFFRSRPAVHKLGLL
eukprot:1338830-Amorphochlora_amoeboformis.AAC.1